MASSDVRAALIADKSTISIKIPIYHLRNLNDINRMYEEQKPDIVIHLAAVVGGIGANLAKPGKFIYDNVIMGIQLLHEAYLHKIEKFVALGTICCFPKFPIIGGHFKMYFPKVSHRSGISK